MGGVDVVAKMWVEQMQQQGWAATGLQASTLDSTLQQAGGLGREVVCVWIGSRGFATYGPSRWVQCELTLILPPSSVPEAPHPCRVCTHDGPVTPPSLTHGLVPAFLPRTRRGGLRTAGWQAD